MHLSDRVTGLFLALLGALSFWGGSLLPAVPGQDVGPAAFPMIIGAALAVCGTLIALGIGRSFEIDEPDPPGSEEVPGLARHLGRAGWLAAFLPPALLIFYVLAVDRLGFLLTAAILLVVAARAMGASWRLTIGLTAVAPFLVHLVFYRLLRVPLPDGLLAPPW